MRYLVVAHQTAISPELHREVRAIISRDAAAEFAILVPATPVQHRFAWEDSETIGAARARAAEARAAFERTGATVVRADVSAAISRSRAASGSTACRASNSLASWCTASCVGTMPAKLGRWR